MISTSQNISSLFIRCCCILLIFISQFLSAEVLFKDDFSDKNINDAPSPTWGWKALNDPSLGMMLGPNDIYSVTDNEFVSNRSSLTVNFNGRNNFCNVCGGDTATVTEINSETSCLSVSGGPHETYAYNQSNNFSAWKVTNSQNNTICINSSKVIPGREALSGASQVKVGDKIYFPKVCGINGTIGGNINRRSDCDRAINYLTNITAENFEYGEILARRFYLYIPSETELPNIDIKLAYFRLKNTYSVITISTQRNSTLGIVLPGGQNIAYSKSDTESFRMPRDKWVYFEEVFQRESAQGAKDGEYTLYLSRDGEDMTKPYLHYNGLTYGELTAISIGGNWQHTNEVKGFFYFDNIMISNNYIGPVNRPKMNLK